MCVECVIYVAEICEGLGIAVRSACEGLVFVLRSFQVTGSLCVRYYWFSCGGIVVDVCQKPTMDLYMTDTPLADVGLSFGALASKARCGAVDMGFLA